MKRRLRWWILRSALFALCAVRPAAWDSADMGMSDDALRLHLSITASDDW